MNLAPAPGPSTWYIDNDGDGYGSIGQTQLSCSQPSGYVINSNDCNDGDPNLTTSGAVCNDGDPNTINDMVTASCTCEGTPVITCIPNQSVTPNTPNCTYQHSGTTWDATGTQTCPTGNIRTAVTNSAQGWTLRQPSGAGATITHYTTGGNPNGYITLTEPGGANTDYFQAPPLFLGNKSGFHNGHLEFDIKTNNVTADPTVFLSHVRLESTDLEIYASIPLPTLSWTSHSIPLSVGEWRINTTTWATAVQIQEVLSDLTAFYIRAEYREGPEITSLDNIGMFPGPISYTLSGATTGTGSTLHGVEFDPGITTVTWSMMNNCAAPFSCSYTVTVTPPNTSYRDADQDGYGDLTNDTLYCGTPPPGYVANSLDCDDSTANLTIPGNACNDGNPASVNDVVTSTCTCEGVTYVDVALKVWLQGADGSPTMRDDLRSAIPALLPLTHPYAGPPFNVQATIPIQPSVLALDHLDNAIVDWLVIELRDAAVPSLILHKRVALLQRDGDVVDLDGVSALRFPSATPGSYHVAVRHRNHLGVTTAAPIGLSQSTTTIDLTDPATPTWGTEARKLAGGKAMLWAGNTNASNNLRYSGSGNDRDPIIQMIYQNVSLPTPTSVVIGVYTPNDVNMDGVVKYANVANDRDPILQNLGGTVSTATRWEQLP
jgi:hypothetical protein